MVSKAITVEGQNAYIIGNTGHRVRLPPCLMAIFTAFCFPAHSFVGHRYGYQGGRSITNYRGKVHLCYGYTNHSKHGKVLFHNISISVGHLYKAWKCITRSKEI